MLEMRLKLICRNKLLVETDVGTPRSGRSAIKTGDKEPPHGG